MPSVGLVNMNARVYDPELGRFLSADSVTENIFFSQVLNRYTYVGNNPLSYTDMTGHSWLSKLFRQIPILRSILAIAVAITLHYYPLIAALGETANAVIGGFISGGISGGTLKSALMGGLQAFAFNGIHGLNIGDVGRALLHGAVGGLASIAQGGSFGSGFISAGFSELVSGDIECVCSDAVNAIRHAIAGGVTSVLAGGKFANGAITAAFGYLYNQAATKGVPAFIDVIGKRPSAPGDIGYPYTDIYELQVYDVNGDPITHSVRVQEHRSGAGSAITEPGFIETTKDGRFEDAVGPAARPTKSYLRTSEQRFTVVDGKNVIELPTVMRHTIDVSIYKGEPNVSTSSRCVAGCPPGH